MHGRTDDERTDGRTDRRRTNRRMDGRTDGRTPEKRKIQSVSQTIDLAVTIKTHTESSKSELSSRGKRPFKVLDFSTNGRTNGRTDGRTNEQTNGYFLKFLNFLNFFKPNIEFDIFDNPIGSIIFV